MCAVCLHVRTGTQYQYCIPVCNTGAQHMCPVCLHVRTCMRIHVRNTGMQYMLQLCCMRYMYCAPERTCKHRLSTARPIRNCDLAQRNFCAILTFSRDRAIFAVERNFRATWAKANFASFEAYCMQTSASCAITVACEL